MHYNSLLHAPPSPSDAGLRRTKTGSLSLPSTKARLPTSKHHRVRKDSLSTNNSTGSSCAGEVKKLKITTGLLSPAAPAKSPLPTSANAVAAVPVTSNPPPPHPLLGLPKLSAWESYLHWLCLTEEPGTLWSSSLCATFHECLAGGGAPGNTSTQRAAECAARIDDIYWSFYLPLDPLLQFMEDRILSGYLLHVWTMFIELGERIPYNDPAQDRLVELLKELVHLPPMEVRTWEGNDAPWTDLPTLDDALVAAWDDLYDPEVQMTDPESSWVNYFAFLGRLVAAGVTPDWWEIPAITLREVLAEDVAPAFLTRYKTMALAEFMNQAGDAFFEWCMDSGALRPERDGWVVAPMLRTPVRQDWFEARGQGRKRVGAAKGGAEVRKEEETGSEESEF